MSFKIVGVEPERPDQPDEVTPDQDERRDEPEPEPPRKPEKAS
jgi:hypothetical protein